ncbi:MAG: hypothetical protein M1819_004182 [Sarea resinae]|nr:MAG: hypothetical protein M1819_004182 [Sarea resinae]
MKPLVGSCTSQGRASGIFPALIHRAQASTASPSACHPFYFATVEHMEHVLFTDSYTYMQGYDSDNPNIDILRLRNYTVGKKLRDDEVMGPGGLNRIAELIGNLTPFITYLNSVVMPDGEESDENEDGEDEDGEDEDGEDEDGEDEDGEDDGGAEEGEGDGEEEKD